VPYRLAREQWARLLGHPATGVAATALAIAVPVTVCAEFARLLLRLPRPPTIRARLHQTLGSAWRGAEIVSGASAYIYVAGSARNALDGEATEAGLRLATQWMRGQHDSTGSRIVAALGTLAFCALTVAFVHHCIRDRIRAKLTQAAERVLDMSEW
jgi:hypothetical protein